MEVSGGAVQPGGGEGTAEGQGAQSQDMDPGLFPGIESVPSEYRQYVDPILKEMDANANRRISEVNQKLEPWKQYEELGVRDIDPERMQGLIELSNLIESAQDDPSGLKEFWEGLGNEFEFMGNEDNDDFDDDDFLEGESGGNAELKEEILSAMQEQLQPFQKYIEQNQQDEFMNQANENIDKQIADVKEKFSIPDDQWNEELEQRIIRLSVPYGEDDNPIEKGFLEFKNIVESAEGNLWQEVNNQPEPAEGPGTPNTVKTAPTDFKEAEAIAKERLGQYS